jgi:hypothetical protein
MFCMFIRILTRGNAYRPRYALKSGHLIVSRIFAAQAAAVAAPVPEGRTNPSAI